jgi:septin family protein
VHQQPGKTSRLFSGSRFGRKSGDLPLAGCRLWVVGCMKIAWHSHHLRPTTNNDQQIMKSAYELAMERLNKQSPVVKLTEQQKKEIAELESKHKAKIAEREISLKDQITAAAVAGDSEKIEKLEEELARERRKLLAELEEKKDQVRQAKG